VTTGRIVTVSGGQNLSLLGNFNIAPMSPRATISFSIIAGDVDPAAAGNWRKSANRGYREKTPTTDVYRDYQNGKRPPAVATPNRVAATGQQSLGQGVVAKADSTKQRDFRRKRKPVTNTAMAPRFQIRGSLSGKTICLLKHTPDGHHP
jgi:hypothetical protein